MTWPQVLFVAAVLLTAAVGAVWWVCRPQPDLSQTLAERIDWSEMDVQESHGVPYLYADTISGGHDCYPQMSEVAREVCIAYLEQGWELPARERAS